MRTRPGDSNPALVGVLFCQAQAGGSLCVTLQIEPLRVEDPRAESSEGRRPALLPLDRAAESQNTSAVKPGLPLPGVTRHATSMGGAILLCLLVPRGLGAQEQPTHWAFQPVRATKPPAVKATSWPITAVDR